MPARAFAESSFKLALVVVHAGMVRLNPSKLVLGRLCTAVRRAAKSLTGRSTSLFQNIEQPLPRETEATEGGEQ